MRLRFLKHDDSIPLHNTQKLLAGFHAQGSAGLSRNYNLVFSRKELLQAMLLPQTRDGARGGT